MKQIAIITALVLSLYSIPAEASPASWLASMQTRSNWNADQARDARTQGKVLPVSRVIAIAQRRHPGSQVLDVSMSGSSNLRYTVILKTRDGRRIDVIIDAEDGRVLSERGA